MSGGAHPGRRPAFVTDLSLRRSDAELERQERSGGRVLWRVLMAQRARR
jgi:hypothetical protein